MRTGRHTLGELFGNRYIERLIIPEIQRDYVWGQPQVTHLVRSILENFNAWRTTLKNRAPLLAADTAAEAADLRSMQEDFAAFHARRAHATNVGFVYAYCDADLPGDYFLIDGQQRITTLYLALLAVAARDARLKERFLARYCVTTAGTQGGRQILSTRLDYRLREYTSEFFHRCVAYLLEHPDDPGSLKEQCWYLQRLEKDATIRHLLENHEVIGRLLDAGLSVPDDLAPLYGYMEDLVEFWYFDTNESAQGEELYIYLNARGESIADNENQKAELLGKITDAAEKERWGREWEEWQDYFWKHRLRGLGKEQANPNADRGFNSFLQCIRHLEALKHGSKGNPAAIGLEMIAGYIAALKWLESAKDTFKARYAYAGWVDKWFGEVWESLNREEAEDWAADYHDENRSTPRNRMVLVWGSLLCATLPEGVMAGTAGEPDIDKVFRALRVIHVRFHNFNRSVAALPRAVAALLAEESAPARGSDEGSGEEGVKWRYLQTRPVEQRREYEAVIWKIEDHPWNLNGRDLGNINLTHLVDLSGDGPSLSHLKIVRDAFHRLFPDERSKEGNARKVALALLYYGTYWNRVSPWYHETLHFGDWRLTLRGKGSSEQQQDPGASVFRKFFDEFVESGENLERFLEQKRGTLAVTPAHEQDLGRALVWYGERLGTAMFEKGMHIIANGIHDPHRPVPGWWPDPEFPMLHVLWNSNGTFKGHRSHRTLAEALPAASPPQGEEVAQPSP